VAGASNGSDKNGEQIRLVRLSPELYEQLRVVAQENQRSIAGEARYAVSLYLRQLERRKAAASV